MAKNGWKLSKVAFYREYPVDFVQKREIVGVGQSDTANNTLCRHCFQVHPFLAKKAPGTPVFGHCPLIYYLESTVVIVFTIPMKTYTRYQVPGTYGILFLSSQYAIYITTFTPVFMVTIFLPSKIS